MYVNTYQIFCCYSILKFIVIAIITYVPHAISMRVNTENPNKNPMKHISFSVLFFKNFRYREVKKLV